MPNEIANALLRLVESVLSDEATFREYKEGTYADARLIRDWIKSGHG